MAKTIIQTIGPLYGEVVNGTVFGRPNGSIYVPPTNTIKITIADTAKYVRVFGSTGYERLICCTSIGGGRDYTVIAESQDIQSYIETYLTDTDGNMLASEQVLQAGIFNATVGIIGTNAGSVTLVADETYVLHAVLCSASGVPVASTSVNVKGVVVS